jgi:hypothetical protein
MHWRYGLNEPIHLRKRTNTLRLAIQRATGVATVRKTASTMKYTVARTKTADFKIRFTWTLILRRRRRRSSQTTELNHASSLNAITALEDKPAKSRMFLSESGVQQ